MAARSIWSGTISFGLVSIPVRMFSATQSKELRFHFVDRTDLAPVGYDKVRKDTGEHVDPDDIVRAYEIEKGRYIPLEPDDLDRLDVELTHGIDICDFVLLEEIDPVYFRQAYFLLPQEGGEKPYRLLDAGTGGDRPGRDREGRDPQQAASRLPPAARRHPRASRRCTTPTRCGSRSRSTAISRFARPKVRKAEVEMATSLVENLSATFDPAKYTDTYRAELKELLEQKAEGAPLPEPKEAKGEVIDLMQALRESVERTQRKRTKRSTAKKAS